MVSMTMLYSLLILVLIPQPIFSHELNSLGVGSVSESYPTNYQISNSVTYVVEINFSLTQLTGTGNYYFKLPRLNNRTPNSTLTPLCPPYQESELIYHDLYGNIPSQTLLNHTDRFKNVYDSYNATLNYLSNPEVKLSSKYKIKLNEIVFDTLTPSDIGTYNASDEIFELYCNQSKVFYNRSDPALISLSNSIVQPSDSVVVKANKIINWISNNIEYNDSLDVEIGASNAYGNLTGDCSEYSSLMITLLRIQGIPARKVTGFCISNIYNLKPEIGDTYEFYNRNDATNLLGHAWVEYYVPNIGWIACDPTWHQVTGTYFNRIDYLRFNYNVGEWFFFPPDQQVSEFPVPYATGSYTGSYSYDFEFKITVINTNYSGIDFMLLLIIASITVAAILLLVMILILRKRRNKNDL